MLNESLYESHIQPDIFYVTDEERCGLQGKKKPEITSTWKQVNKKIIKEYHD